jgi:antibiotic biosynthesis monooxygenase (ABM) superfamily enzyme
MDLNNFIWAMVVCFVLSVIIRLWFGAKFLESMARHEQIERLKKLIHDVNVERKEGVEYWFDNETDQFLAQGKTLDEIVTKLKSRYPDHIFLLPGQGGLAAKTNWQVISDDAELTRTLSIK